MSLKKRINTTDLQVDGEFSAITTQKADLIVRGDTTNERLPVGLDSYVLTADSAEATGLKWSPPPSDGFGIFAYAVVQSSGTIDDARNLNVVRDSTGTYSITFIQQPPNANYGVVSNIFNEVTDTNTFVSLRTTSGFRLLTGQGDNGTTPDVLIDSDFSILVFGPAGGITGASDVYNLWLSLGNTGTEQEFIDSLIGRPGIVWRNTWSNLITYNEGDAVEFNGSSYISITDTNINSTPSDLINWTLLAQEGTTGAQGAQGIQGNPGLVWRNIWLVSTSYNIDDAVQYEGSSYICRQANIGITPDTGLPFWDLIAQKGDTGVADNLPVLQVIRSTNFALPAAFTDITWDIVEVENQPTVLERDDTLTARILIKEDGNYLVSYNGVGNDGVFRLFLNNTSSIPSSETQLLVPGVDIIEISFTNTCIISATAGDFITLQGNDNGNTGIAEVQAPTFLNITKLAGSKGVTGAPGDRGIMYRGVWSSVFNYILYDAVSFEGTLYFSLTSNTNIEPDTSLGVDWEVLSLVDIQSSAIDHNLTTNYVAQEHINWTSTSENLNTSGTITGSQLTTNTFTLTNGAQQDYILRSDSGGIASWAPAFAYASYTSNDSTTNLNNNGTIVPWNVITTQESPYSLNVGTGEVTINQSGLYQLYFNVELFSPGGRTNLFLKYLVNNTPQIGTTANNYIRDQDSHNESSSSLQTILPLNFGDIVSVRAERATSTLDNVTLTPGGCLFTIIKLR
jgi:hypothetical protein